MCALADGLDGVGKPRNITDEMKTWARAHTHTHHRDRCCLLLMYFFELFTTDTTCSTGLCSCLLTDTAFDLASRHSQSRVEVSDSLPKGDITSSSN